MVAFTVDTAGGGAFEAGLTGARGRELRRRIRATVLKEMLWLRPSGPPVFAVSVNATVGLGDSARMVSTSDEADRAPGELPASPAEGSGGGTAGASAGASAGAAGAP